MPLEFDDETLVTVDAEAGRRWSPGGQGDDPRERAIFWLSAASPHRELREAAVRRL